MGASKDVVADGMVVELQYTLKNDKGDVLDQSDEGDPLAYLHGAENIVPGLENALEGKKKGEQVKVRVTPEEGYGPKIKEDKLLEIPRKAFPPDADLEPGIAFALERDNGEEVQLWVEKIDKKTVYCTANHPLAGEHLNFDVTILSIRAATKSEIEHGHPHSGDGHHH